ncbi:phage tape measure protein [uncultured Mediterranean phage uvMED]|nr:phage tape measure protein [uncultured Mediterranean phage uvMED]BAR20768.1 phage tape measure protein [uncultured Mediterranean phage uvMED]BAR20781.1 phage tape measure protein [uncultured Mediterranean phage uvMED]BAR20876.1 phage tape measure protein [uncultured Mediterranean phage uvMED]BAR20914.1 phage tape measure protein [uncultured Mediterranean phage uvMED]
MAQANVKLTVDASGATRALNGVQKQTNVLQKSFGGLRTALAGIGLLAVGRSAVKTSANFEKLNVRLGLLTKASGTFAKSQKIAADAQKAFGLSAIEALEGVTDITARLAPLKVGVEDIRTVFFGFNTAAKLAGASAMESSNAFRQLAQALGSGRLAGDEFRSVSEQVPTVLAPIAAELGVTIGELKQLAAEGKLTSDVVLRALGRVGNEGSGFLKQLLKNDPTQVFKNFSNATEDLSRAFGAELRPAVESVTKLLTEFITKTVDFIESDAGQAAVLITKIAVAVKLLSVAIPLATAAFTALLVKVNAVGVASLIASSGFTGMQAAALLAAGGIGKTTLALGAMKIAMATTGIGAFVLLVGGLTTAIIGARKEQKKFNEALKSGDEQLLKSEFNKLFIERQKLLKRLSTAQENNNKRAVASLQRQLGVNNQAITQIKEKLDEERKTTAEIERQNEKKKEQEEQLKKNKEAAEELRKKFTEIGEEIESSIKNNLRDAITGAKTFGEAMTGVLNRIRDKIIDAQLDKLIGGFGEAFGKSASGGEKKGLGGILGSILGGLFANGGQPPVNKISVVGERGPELFVPTSKGTIIPNNAMGGESVVNNVTVNVDASGSAVSGSSADGNELGQQIAVAIQSELIKQKRVGGLLS